MTAKLPQLDLSEIHDILMEYGPDEFLLERLLVRLTNPSTCVSTLIRVWCNSAPVFAEALYDLGWIEIVEEDPNPTWDMPMHEYALRDELAETVQYVRGQS